MNEIEANTDPLDGLKGHAIVDWRPGEGGVHFELDNGSLFVVAISDGLLFLGVYPPRPDHVVH